MKTPRLLLTGLSFALAFLLSPAGLHGQGALVPPPGAPAPTMKTLDQVEARTIVNATNTPGDATNTFIISVPGSYYLTGNITGAPTKNGVSIQTNDVTLDLNGFALISGSPGGFIGGSAGVSGVHVPLAQSGIRVRNGSVRGWSFAGVWAGLAVTLAENLCLTGNTGGIGLCVGNGSLVRDSVASGNWVGFYLSDRTQISNCIATENTGGGFNCQSYVTIIDCTASRNFGSAGINALGSCSIIRCSATRNIPVGHGIRAGPGCTIVDCTASNNQFDGIKVDSATTVRNCTAEANGRNGISVTSNCQVTGNTCSANSATPNETAAGIAVIGNRNRIDGNTCTSNLYHGIYLSSSTAGNLLVRNLSTGHPTIALVPLNYSLGSSQDSSLNGTAIVVEARGNISSASPWANFSD